MWACWIQRSPFHWAFWFEEERIIITTYWDHEKWTCIFYYSFRNKKPKIYCFFKNLCIGYFMFASLRSADKFPNERQFMELSKKKLFFYQTWTKEICGFHFKTPTITQKNNAMGTFSLWLMILNLGMLDKKNRLFSKTLNWVSFMNLSP